MTHPVFSNSYTTILLSLSINSSTSLSFSLFPVDPRQDVSILDTHSHLTPKSSSSTPNDLHARWGSECRTVRYTGIQRTCSCVQQFPSFFPSFRCRIFLPTKPSPVLVWSTRMVLHLIEFETGVYLSSSISYISVVCETDCGCNFEILLRIW